MEFLQSILAGILDKFKTKNPMIFALVAVALITLNQLAGNAIEWGLLDPATAPWLPKAMDILTQVLIVLTGSRTVKYMAGPAQMKVMNKIDNYD